ncbi:hypothetical protein PR048_009557 [Dryococelus australis]|uniref:Nudix hydrolase domain-containing protein n=1 Tax=Dryococelus australis TaxID=614101 RepID=A0ABQ9I084_9NEOP|nr:hypothetical protein PR048_009557 [Dryococelus australis]
MSMALPEGPDDWFRTSARTLDITVPLECVKRRGEDKQGQLSTAPQACRDCYLCRVFPYFISALVFQNMDGIEANVRSVLAGQSITDTEEFCDFTLEQQNEATVAKGIAPAAASDFVPIVKSTVTYIVVGILLNEHDEVLMMQEAKSSCAGKWYLPAGRMEPGEDIEEAVKREVLEETGLEMEPTTLLMVECASGSWFRFVITGNAIGWYRLLIVMPRGWGGILKTPKDADSESLQAKWVRDLNELSLRADDIHNIVERARYFSAARGRELWHADILPALVPHTKLLFRLVVCIRKKSK